MLLLKVPSHQIRSPEIGLVEQSLMSIRIAEGTQIFKCRLQCSGSGFTRSTCFWAPWIRIRIHQSEVWIRIRLWVRIRILLSSCKNSKKNLDSYYFVTLFDSLSLRNDVNVPSKSNKQKKLCKKVPQFFAGILKVNDENSRILIQDPDPHPNPDSLVGGMDPPFRIRIHPKMSWIRNTGRLYFFFQFKQFQRHCQT